MALGRGACELDTVVTKESKAARSIQRGQGVSLAVNVEQSQGGAAWDWLVPGGAELQPPTLPPIPGAAGRRVSA